jgi:hypothetical protein
MPLAKNKIRRFGPFAWTLDPHGEALIPGSMMFMSHLGARLLGPDGQPLEEYDLGSGLVTTAGVNLMATDWNASANNQTLKLANWHHSGTGATAAAIGDTTLQTPTADARATGTQSNPASGQYRTVATCSYAGSQTITEWGLFTATTSGTLWDRRTFTGIATDTSTSIEFTYTLTINAGG